MVEAQPAGVRLALRPSSWTHCPTPQVYQGLPARPVGVYDLLVDGQLTDQASVTGGDKVTVDMTPAPSSTGPVRPAPSASPACPTA